MAVRSAGRLASMAASHSVSKPPERLLRLAEPMRTSRSSITATLEWTMIGRPAGVWG
ncbi:MAG: hypothetical protein WDM92_11875 [Caulobacteraceae bacterium]